MFPNIKDLQKSYIDDEVGELEKFRNKKGSPNNDL